MYLNKTILRLTIAFVLPAVAACSELIPGININEGSPGAHHYQVVHSDKNNDYEVVTAAPAPQYDVEPITSDLLVAMAKNRSYGDFGDVPSLLPSNVPPEYKLGPGDVFFVVVWDHPELTSPYTGLTSDITNQGRLVAADGTTFYPFVGTFKASGLTATQIRNYLSEHLKGFIQNPQVDVRVVAYRAGRIEVTGEVLKPGTINIDDTPKGVLQAIDASGGLTQLASRRRAILEREGSVHVIDLSGLLSGSRLVANPELKPGDVLHIPDQSGDQVFVLGAVTKQAPYIILQDSASLIEVLSASGGLDSAKGKDSGILVFRPHLAPDSTVAAKIFTLDLSRADGVLLASQFQMEPHDVVYVKETAFAQYNSIISQLLPTVTGAYQAILTQCLAKGSVC